MTNISEVARPPLGVLPPPLEEPEEFCPVKLLWLCRQHYGWNTEKFSWVFGWNEETIRKWHYGRQKPSKQARIRAATLKQMWKI